MNVLIVHNRYRIAGGEDTVVEAERGLLEARGHDVTIVCESNENIGGVASAGSAAVSAVYSRAWERRAVEVIQRARPDVLHVHNFFPLISPSVYFAARKKGVPIVQTLHNYRLMCPNGLFFTRNKPCERCLGKVFAWPGVLDGCYRGSRLASATVAAMTATHRALGTWQTKVDIYIVLTELARQKFIVGGLPAEKTTVKPNFVFDPGVGTGGGGYALYVGRVSEEKGVRVMLDAWRTMRSRIQSGSSPIPLKIVGDGPLAEELKREYTGLAEVEWLGSRPRIDVYKLMANARTLIFPSVWSEGMPLTLIESFASGTPVVASNLGAMSTMVEHGRTGLHFEAGSSEGLASGVEWVWANEREWAEMRRGAREEYEVNYTPERNYEILMAIYEQARLRRDV